MLSCSPMLASRQVPLSPLTLYLDTEGFMGPAVGAGLGGTGGTVVGEGMSCLQRVSAGTVEKVVEGSPACCSHQWPKYKLRTENIHPSLSIHCRPSPLCSVTLSILRMSSCLLRSTGQRPGHSNSWLQLAWMGDPEYPLSPVSTSSTPACYWLSLGSGTAPFQRRAGQCPLCLLFVTNLVQ
jgi:hypothetical protein